MERTSNSNKKRRPKEHIRTVNGKVVQVNDGVYYDEKHKKVNNVTKADTFDGLSALTVNHVKAAVFPDPKYFAVSKKASKKGRFFPHLREGFKINSFLGLEFATVKRHLDWSTGFGRGEIELRLPKEFGFGRKKEKLVVGPGAEVSATFSADMDYRRFDFTGASFGSMFKESLDFSGALLNEASFSTYASLREVQDMRNSGFELHGYCITDCDFTGASCRNTLFTGNMLLPARKDISFRGADLTGAVFEGVAAMGYPTGKYGEKFKVDFTDSNITSEQIHELEQGSHGDLRNIKYSRFTVDEIVDKFGLPQEEIGLMIWAQDIEVRDNETQEIVKGKYNKELHHIPQWEVQKLAHAHGGG